MRIYTLSVKETIKRNIIVEDDNICNAIQKVKTEYAKRGIVLNTDGYEDKDIDIPLYLKRKSETNINEVLSKIMKEIRNMDYPSVGIGCGLEDAQIMDRYEAAAYGWNEAIEKINEIVHSFIA